MTLTIHNKIGRLYLARGVFRDTFKFGNLKAQLS